MSEPLQLRVRKKMMDMFAQRDHSESELRKKLHEKFREEDDVDEAIEEAVAYAKKNHWLGNPTDLAQSLAENLHRKNKGIEYINNSLKEKGLPPVSIDRQQELEKARALVRGKFPNAENFTEQEKARVARFLASRGFDEDTVRTIVFDELDL